MSEKEQWNSIIELTEYLITADPKDIRTYLEMKRLGILLVSNKKSQSDTTFGNIIIHKGDQLLDLHLLPQLSKGNGGNSFVSELRESLYLTSDYIKFHGLKPKYITGCSNIRLVTLAQKVFGATPVWDNIPEEQAQLVRLQYSHSLNTGKKPKVGLFFTTTESFQNRFPPRI